MFDFFNNWRQVREEARATRESLGRQREYEEKRRAEYQYEREKKIEGVQIITGDIKHRYVIVRPLIGFGHYIAPPNEEYDPLEATRRATYHLQAQAVDIGAEAVIHAQFHIIRFTEPRGPRYAPLPAYEVHAFGTAIRVIGPPVDWEAATDSAE